MKLKKFTVLSGGQFNPDTTGPVVVDFSNSKFVGATGDQESGKSTLLDLFLMTVGQNGGEEVVSRLKNKDNELIETELEFVGKDKADYTVKNKNGRLTVKREGSPTTGGPAQFLRNQLGVVGVSPMDIKNAPVDKIVKWLASYSSRGADAFEADMKKIKDAVRSAVKGRADANRSVKGIREYLVSEGVSNSKGEIIEAEWKANEKKFAKEPDLSELSKKLTAAGKNSDNYLKVTEHLKSMEENKERQEKEVEFLRKQLKDKEADLTDTIEQVKKDEEWIEKNKSFKTDYDAVKKQYDNAAQDSVDFNKWKEIKAKKKEMDEFETVAQSFDAKEKDLLKQKQELEWEVIPDIKGVQILLDDTHEDEGEQKKAGFYFKGLDSSQLSNSEWFGLVMQILKKNKVNVLVVDDISQFGSKFMETLESLVKSGCYVLVTEMARGCTELEIQYK